jgi:hypothetical protein
MDKLVDNNILLIFAVTENQKHNYEVRTSPSPSILLFPTAM